MNHTVVQHKNLGISVHIQGSIDLHERISCEATNAEVFSIRACAKVSASMCTYEEASSCNEGGDEEPKS